MTGKASTARELLARERPRILAFLAANGARDVHLFGSLARSDDDPLSDVDLLVRLDEQRSAGSELLRVLALSDELSELLQTRVHVVTLRTLRPEVRETAIAEAVPL
jgi:uncharacterized protein